MSTITVHFPWLSRLHASLATLLLCLLSALIVLGSLTWSLQNPEATPEAPSPFTTPAMRTLPMLHQGRFRPMEAYSRLWLEERYGSSSIHQKDLEAFPGSDGSALDILWRWILHQESLAHAPLFRISPHVRASLERIHHPAVVAGSTHLSYQQIHDILQEESSSSTLLTEARPLETQAWVELIRVWAEPKEWKLVPPRTLGGNWLSQAQAPEEIGNLLKRAQEANNQHAQAQVFEDMHALSSMLHARYTSLAGHPALSAPSLKLYYPTEGQLWAESLYVRVPGIFILLVCYGCGAGALACSLLWKGRYFYTIGYISLGVGWLLHALLLLTRCYILGRPPVSNMFETVLYVPWIGMLIGWIVAYRSLFGTKILLAAACSALLLLSLIPLTGMRGGMENVQAVLDSRFWLIIHVLMVVGSYGAFFVSGLLAHGFLVRHLFHTKSRDNAQNRQSIQSLSSAILLTLYIGVALLIPGTLLGGVWAAQSWGRFWDWDPKESWACITSCIYLFVIHLYRFGRIQALGLAFGSIIGLLAVSFTWYGVNYLLGVGLHSYGFGHGGETAYICYLLAECLFLAFCAFNKPLLKSSEKSG